MLEATGDIWLLARHEVICITTNGDVKGDGSCIMGRGTALRAKQRYPLLPYEIGQALMAAGEFPTVTYHTLRGYRVLVTFPVKYHWYETANLELIENSTRLLRKTADRLKWKHIFVPRPGCGNGGLVWEEVLPILLPYFDDRFTLVTL
jgi:hypothetical protein